jgi:hypothetical protein
MSLNTKATLLWNKTTEDYNTIGTVTGAAHSLKLIIKEFQSIFSFWAASLSSRGK